MQVYNYYLSERPFFLSLYFNLQLIHKSSSLHCHQRTDNLQHITDFFFFF